LVELRRWTFIQSPSERLHLPPDGFAVEVAAVDNVLESGPGDPGGPGEQRCRVFTAPLLLFLPCAE